MIVQALVLKYTCTCARTHTQTHALLLRVSELSSFTILPHFVLHPSFSHDAFFPLHMEGVVGECCGRGTCLPCVLTPVSLASRPHALCPVASASPGARIQKAREPVGGGDNSPSHDGSIHHLSKPFHTQLGKVFCSLL